MTSLHAMSSTVNNEKDKKPISKQIAKYTLLGIGGLGLSYAILMGAAQSTGSALAFIAVAGVANTLFTTTESVSSVLDEKGKKNRWSDQKTTVDSL